MTRRAGRHPDPVRVVAAALGGTAERCVIGKGMSDDEALADMAACLAPLPAEKRPDALAFAAARYVASGRAWDVAIAELLARAGADLDRARVMWAERPGHGFTVR